MHLKWVDFKKYLWTTRDNRKAKTPDFTGVLGHFRIVSEIVRVEMAGIEPASRTLLETATTLIFGV